MEHKFQQFYDQQGLLRILTWKCTLKMTSFTPTTTITMTRPPTTTVTQSCWTWLYCTVCRDRLPKKWTPTATTITISIATTTTTTTTTEKRRQQHQQQHNETSLSDLTLLLCFADCPKNLTPTTMTTATKTVTKTTTAATTTNATNRTCRTWLCCFVLPIAEEVWREPASRRRCRTRYRRSTCWWNIVANIFI